MTDLLTPPPEQDLPPTRAAEIRRVVMRSAGSTRRRRPGYGAWLLVPAVAALVVVVVVFGLRPGQGPSVVGSPSPAPSLSSTPRLSADEVDTDAGPLSETEAVAAVDDLIGRFSGPDAEPGSPAPLVAVVLARRTTTELGDGTYVVWTDTRGATWCAISQRGSMGPPVEVTGPEVRHPRMPDADRPVLRTLDDELNLNFTWHEDSERDDATARDLYSGNFYLASDAVDRVEVRITVEGKPGPWYTAAVHDGYAYVPAVAPGPHSTSEHINEVTTIEDRAFDRDGSLVPIVQR